MPRRNQRLESACVFCGSSDEADPAFLAATGLQASLTPSRANGFLNIFRTMQAQARQLAEAA